MSDEPVYPRVEIIQHDRADEGQWLARKLVREARDEPAVAANVARHYDRSELTKEFACGLTTSSEGWRCSTLADTPVGPVSAVGPTQALAVRRMHREYLHALENRKACSGRQEALLTAARARFYAVNLS